MALVRSCAAALALAAGLSAGDAKKDAERIQGAWKVVRYVERGTEGARDEIEHMEVVFKGPSFEIKVPGGAGKKGTFKLNPSRKPAGIDLFGGDETKPMAGIYAFDGLTLKICTPSGPDIAKGIRPSDFTSTRDNRNVLMVLEARKAP
jgi:uncharacterized protein (TIGR03067 family)